jgi:hypothetical protein
MSEVEKQGRKEEKVRGRIRGQKWKRRSDERESGG